MTSSKKNHLFLKKYRLFAVLTTVLVGSIFFLSVMMHLSVSDNRLVIESSTSQVKAAEGEPINLPTFIRIPQLEIGIVVKQTSSTNENGYAAFHYTNAKNLSSRHTIIYAQNTPSLFGNIASLHQGDEIMLITQDGTMHTFLVEKGVYTSLTNLTTSQEEGLFLTTPTLFQFQKRLVIEARPKK